MVHQTQQPTAADTAPTKLRLQPRQQRDTFVEGAHARHLAPSTPRTIRRPALHVPFECCPGGTRPRRGERGGRRDRAAPAPSRRHDRVQRIHLQGGAEPTKLWGPRERVLRFLEKRRVGGCLLLLFLSSHVWWEVFATALSWKMEEAIKSCGWSRGGEAVHFSFVAFIPTEQALINRLIHLKFVGGTSLIGRHTVRCKLYVVVCPVPATQDEIAVSHAPSHTERMRTLHRELDTFFVHGHDGRAADFFVRGARGAVSERSGALLL